ncbi:MAG: acylneuraminate cytidylyltransferase [Chloroflexi bacterium]|nr:glycosyltransferase family protein [Anaerolineales bacterium]RIK50191.1 MAG: acylneuraminate cytidylyltransferase [Chloroflexota bacterium]
MKPNIVAIIQGRMSSSRLPGKILADMAGQPMLQRVFVRTSRSASVSQTLFATTTDASDDPVAEYCAFSGIPFTRGSLYDVLDRYYQAAKSAKADVVVRITADCPVIDPELIDNCANTLLDDDYDFVCNRLPPPYHRTYPIGLDVEACTFKALEQAWKKAKEPQHREHVMPYFYEGVELTTVNRQLQTGTSPRGYNIALLHHTTDFGDYRWTVDTPEDLEFMRQVYSHFNGRDDFSWKEVLDLVHDNPELMKINAGVQHKTLKDIDKRAIKK